MNIWRKIRKTDLEHLDQHASRFDPYCNLDIVDLWGYRIDPAFWFEVGDTIVYRLNDYMDDSPYITMLGESSVMEAISMISKAESTRKRLILKCLPEAAWDAMRSWDAVLSHQEDHDNHDYIFELQSLINFSTESLQRQQKGYRKLLRKYPNLHMELLDCTKKSDRRKLYRMFNRWVKQTGATDYHKEYRALKRALVMEKTHLICFGFFDGKKMVGYTVNRPSHNGYYQAYFGKAQRGYHYLTLFQEHITAKYMHEHFGCTFMNLQPDSGIEGLRNYKTSLGPHSKLKKYTVVIDASKARIYS